MRSRLFSLFLFVLVCSISAAGQTVVESGSSVSIEGKTAKVRIAVSTDTDLSNIPASIELIDPNGEVRAQSVTRTVSIRSGSQTLEFDLPVGDILSKKDDDMAWYRLRYKIGDSTGVIAMSQMLGDLFELRIIACEYLMTGTTYRVRIRATNPFTERPASGVVVETVVSLGGSDEGDKKTTLTGRGETDADGFAVVDLTIAPETKLSDEGQITVTGTRNGIVREAEEDLKTMKEDVRFLTLTDKPIYQPEQMLNIRGILMKGAESKTVLTGSEVEFRITDEDDTVLYREKVKSSDFGIAAISWRIPANAKLGNYRIEIRDESGEQIGGERIKVSRYDLPNFAVQAKPAKPYYLPSENEAEVEVRADYLFGKPVTSGKVRVVQEDRREWNYKEQRYDVNEGQVREGTADAEGKFIAKLDLKEQQESFKEDNWRKYQDIHFAAYFTDLTTNKTEQRRFDIRLTREPIHVYLIGDTYGLNPSLPVNVYVSTFYADGSPAECDVEIKASEEKKEQFKTVARLKTNSFGAGKLVLQKPKIGEPGDDLDFVAFAKDKAGRRGTYGKTITFDEAKNEIDLVTDKTIYLPGEMIGLKITSTIKSGPVYIDIVNGWSVIDSHFAVLKNGRAEIQIPYLESFKGELKVAAFMENTNDDIVQASNGIIFPARQGIALTSDLDKAIYKPGEEVTVKYGVVDAIGQAVKSALGIVVLDKAVEERARTDSEFGGMLRGFGEWIGYGRGFGSVNVKDLNEIDLTKPVSSEMQLVAELILHDDSYYPRIFHSNRYFAEAKGVFSQSLEKQFAPVGIALKSVYDRENYLHAVDGESLNRILASRNLRFEQMTDPWGTPYRAKFSVEKERDVVAVLSAGPDKKFDTKDDFAVFSTGFEYFTSMGNAIDTVQKNYMARTGQFIRDEKTLYAELGVRELLDRFGRPYAILFEPQGRFLQIRVRSSGPDGKFEKYEWGGDDFFVWTSRVDYFAPFGAKIYDSQRLLKTIPMNEAGFRASLREAGIDFDQIRDGWGNPLYITVNQRSRYWDKVTIETVQNYGDPKSTERRVITPVTQQIIEFTIRSSGTDGKPGTYDDFTLTQIVHVLAEQTKDDPKPVPVIKPVAYYASSGSISGVVTDPAGAVIPNAAVTATNLETKVARSVVTGSSGDYMIASLAAGKYSVRVAATSGFMSAVVNNIKVTANNTTKVDVVLAVAASNATVDVSAGGDLMETTTASMTTVTSQQIANLPINARNMTQLVLLAPGTAGSAKDNSTPRIREYFPETLFWQPELVTGDDGKAEAKFKTADNITTWKMYTIASTKNGKVGVAEKEFTAFQPFFVDLDPPKFLTEGDEIYLPTQVRNYTDKRQQVDMTMAKADWFTFLGADKQRIAVDAGNSNNSIFGFKAVSPVKDGKQRVTAIAQTDSDAIERPVTVRPDGQEIVRTDSRFAAGTQRMDLAFPANALPRTQKAELKIFPNLYSHVAESVEGLLHRPYGCGEQTISSTYPNLMILKFVRPDAVITKKARAFLQKGYERLLGYQVADGGFTYWGGKDRSDIALTAYAIRFLTDAGSQITVDGDVIKRASDWLIKQQRTDGSWSQGYVWETKEDVKRTKLLTTYIARSLAMNKDSDKNALKKALDYLRARNDEIDEPYALALYGLASLDAGDRDAAVTVARRLEAMAIGEGDGVYWNLETNTPFYGWGTAGRIETTALVTHLLVRVGKDAPSPKTASLISKGMIFLLKNKDRYGVWYSTQTTINVLDAFVAAIGTSKTTAAQQLNITLNGQPFGTIDVAADRIEPVVIDLTGKLGTAANSIEVRSTSADPMMTQLVASHYIDWKDADLSGRTVNQSRALRLDYKCDKQSAAIMQEVTCSVEAERVAFQGYGMLLAEIGTPPGADVSRESLEKAIGNDWNISRYDILPDRIVVYMWARPGGTKFSFKFKPRYAINAQTPSSVVYDYYNPEAQATAAPLRFVVK